MMSSMKGVNTMKRKHIEDTYYLNESDHIPIQTKIDCKKKRIPSQRRALIGLRRTDRNNILEHPVIIDDDEDVVFTSKDHTLEMPIPLNTILPDRSTSLDRGIQKKGLNDLLKERQSVLVNDVRIKKARAQATKSAITPKKPKVSPMRTPKKQLQDSQNRTCNSKDQTMAKTEDRARVLRSSTKQTVKPVKEKKPTKKMDAIQMNPKKLTDESLMIHTRMNPKKLTDAIQMMNAEQQKAIRMIGFGSFLSMKIDSIPSNMTHYIVDNFDTHSMTIKTKRGNIEVTKQSIGDILGIPVGGTSIFSLPSRAASDVYLGWFAQFDKKSITATDIKKCLILQKDGGRMFLMNFLLLFVNTMCATGKNGKCNKDVLSFICDFEDLASLDWSGYVFDILLRCKSSWHRTSENSWFAGPLTYLTLLYVDRTVCNEVEVPRTRPTIEGWNSGLLRLRATVECQNGGFGQLSVQGPYVDSSNHRKEDVDDAENINDAEAFMVCLNEKLKEFESFVLDGVRRFPEDERIISFGRKASVLFDSGVSNVGVDEGITREQATPEPVRCDSIIVTQPGETRVLSSPTVQFRIDRTIEQHIKTKTVDNKCYKEMPKFDVEQGNVRSKRVTKPVEALCSPFIRRVVVLDDPIQAVEQKVVDMLCSMSGDPREEIFTMVNGLCCWRVMIESLVFPDEWVYGQVIDCWSAILNAEEAYRKKGSQSRLFFTQGIVTPKMNIRSLDVQERFKDFNQRLIDGIKDYPHLRDFKGVGLLFFPICEHNHFYLCVANLSKPGFYIIDNSSEGDLNKYGETPETLQWGLCQYLDYINHPKSDAMKAKGIVRMNMNWRTSLNHNDCGVFVMRHMETFKGQPLKAWDCGLQVEGDRQKRQLEVLRKKYAAKILLSELNTLKSRVIGLVNEFDEYDDHQKRLLLEQDKSLIKLRLACV